MPDEVIVETPRLLLRRLRLSDLDDLVRFYSDPDVIRYIPDAPRSYEDTKDELEWFLNGHPRFPELGLWATIYKPTGAFIGRCGLLPWTIEGQDDVEIAFALSRAYWGRGLATEAARAIARHAFENLNVSRLICLIDHDNRASIKVATKLGMRFEREARDEHGPFLIYAMNK